MPVVPLVVVDVVPEVLVAVVAVVIVPDVSVEVPAGIAEVEVEDEVSVDIVEAVSVAIVPDVSDELTAVSVAAVSVLAASSFLQPKAKRVTATRASRVTSRDFFMWVILLIFSGLVRPVSLKTALWSETGIAGVGKSRGLPESPSFACVKVTKSESDRTMDRGLVGVSAVAAADGAVVFRSQMAMSSAVARTAPPVSGIVESFDGARIAYDLHDLPPSELASRTLVLVVPGFWRFRKHPSMLAFAARLNDFGYRAAIIDPRGHGDSGGTYGFNLHEHHDVAAVAAELLGRLPIDGIALCGLSYGGAIAVSTAARHPELPLTSLLLISPVADFGMIVPRINPFTIHRHIAWTQAFHRPRFDWTARRSAKLRALDDIRDVHTPVSFIHVKDDWLINHTHSEALYAAANEPKELHVLDIPGQFHADHIFRIPEAGLDEIVKGWLGRIAP